MQITITLTDQELEFLQTLQKFMNLDMKSSDEKGFTLEDIIHECIKTAISLGIDMHRGQA